MLGSDAPVSPLAGFGTAVLVASTSVALVCRSAAPSLVKAFYQTLFTAALLMPVALVRHRDTLAIISGRDLLATGGAGAAPVAHFASWLESLNHTTIIVSITLVQSRPFSVAIGVWAVLDERASCRTVVGIGVALAGMTLTSVSDSLTTGDASRPLLGSELVIAGAVTVVAYVFTSWGVRSRVSFAPYVVVVYSICVAALLVIAVGRGDPLTGYPPREWLLFLGTTVGPSIFGHTAINWALARLGSSVVSVSLLGKPISNMIPVLFPLGETPTFPTVLGGAVILGDIYVSVS